LIKLGDITKYRTPHDVAQWIFDEVMRRGVLDHATAVHEIEKIFGNEFIYENENGNWAINPDVLAALRKLGDTIVWERGSREWRKRHSSDKPGRRQD
jgi:hypothetical protein